MLGKTQKLVLYGIVKYPELTDRKIAQRLGITAVSFSQAKNALANKGLYTTHYIPAMQKLGHELLCISFGNINPSVPDETRDNIGKVLNSENVENFYTVLESSQGINIASLRNYAEYTRNRTAFESSCVAAGLIEKESFRHVLFPFEESTIQRFFDFAPLLNKFLGLDREDVSDGKKTVLEFNIVEDRRGELTEMEKLVFYILVKHPSITDMALSRISGTSRGRVAKLRKRFEDEGFLSRLNIPNVKALGLEMMGLFHVKMRTLKSPNSWRKANEVIGWPNATAVIFGDHELVVIAGGICDFDTFTARRDEVLSRYRKIGLFEGEPYYGLLSIRKSRIVKNLDFAPIVKKTLGL